MKAITLGLRVTQENNPIKKVCISKTIGGAREPKTYYRFTSPYDECNYLYLSEYGLEHSLECYERDTRWTGFKYIEYYTFDEEIELEWCKNVPF